ncbi:MAG: T9SS type A sorting domain-containing protein [Williamsia sp.]|nr:T9SS type A sorting domain-containing protein [Williamsia sp.]
MRVFIFLALEMTVLSGTAFCQCPEAGLKTQSSTCDILSNLRVETKTCSTLNLKWKGKQNQVYIVRAVSTNIITAETYEAETLRYSCDFSGNCSAVIPVKVGMNITWSVQGRCTEGGITIYGYKQEGQSVTIPSCSVAPIIVSKTLRTYPNPTAGDLIVDYNGNVNDNTKFTVFDMTGQTILSVSNNAITKTSDGCKLNLHGLTSGSYLLNITNGKEMSQAKFIVFAH